MNGVREVGNRSPQFHVGDMVRIADPPHIFTGIVRRITYSEARWQYLWVEPLDAAGKPAGKQFSVPAHACCFADACIEA